MEEAQVIHNSAKQRYELPMDGALALLEYKEQGKDVLVFTHTFVPPELRGKNIAAILTRFALDDARSQGKKVHPQCTYVDSFIRRNQEYADLRADSSNNAPSCGMPRHKAD
ncbi:MAG: N-acetyltransferase [Desulfobulbaceae bacterium]|nr:N-acetyltransferase [Desulfobulbaceae bacterium]